MIEPFHVATRGYLALQRRAAGGGGSDGERQHIIMMPPPPREEEPPEVKELRREAREKTFKLKQRMPHIPTVDFDAVETSPLDLELMIELVNVQTIAFKRQMEDELLLWVAID